MFNPDALSADRPDPDFLKSLLEPLFDDFQYWFERSRALLETQKLEFLGAEQQADLLARVQQAQQELSSAKLLFQALGGNAGIDTSVLLPWHHLVTECWQVSRQSRSQQVRADDSGIS